MPPEKSVNFTEVINAIWSAKGKVSQAAEIIGVSVRTVYRYAKENADVQTAIDSARETFDEELLDRAESGLLYCVNKKRPWAIRYALSTKGKTRGYVERQEVTGKDGEPLVNLSGDERAARLVELLQRVEDRINGDGDD